MRIVSLLPSATEICFALGLGPSLVGVTHECDFPPQAEFKPRLTESVLNHEGAGPADIDRHIQAALHEGSSLYRLDQEGLKRARPDLILTQELCAVCAVSYSQVLDAAKVLPGRPAVVSLEPASVAQVLRSIADIGQVTGTQDRAAELVRGLWARVDAVRGAVAQRPRPRVVCLEWLDPLMVAGHWVPDQVEIAGGEPLLSAAGEPSRKVTAKELVEARPEVIVCMPCGYRLADSLQQARGLVQKAELRKLAAVKQGDAYAADGSWYFNRPGPRVVDGIEILAKILHPEAWRGPVPLGAQKL